MVAGSRRPRLLASLAVVALLLGTGLARAADEDDPHTCPSAMQAGIERLDLGGGVRARALRCPAPGMVIVRLVPPEGPPLDVELRGGGEGAFAQAGGIGLSPILQVADWNDVPAPQREAFQALVGAAERGELPVAGVAGILPAAIRTRRVPWLLGGALLAVAAAAWSRRRRESRQAPLPTSPSGPQWPIPPQVDPGPRHVGLLLFGVAVALRLAGGAWAPWHVNGHGPSWLLRTWQMTDLMPGYGPGYPELFSGPVWLLPLAPDTAVFVANLLIAAALAPLLYRLGRSLGLSWGPAALVGALAALDPLSLRFAASEACHPALLVGLHGAELLLVMAAVRLAADRRVEGVLLALAGALVAAQTARIHPMAWPMVALAPLPLLAVPGRRRTYPLVAVAVAGLLVGLALLVTAGPGGLERVLGSGPLSGGEGLGGLVDGLTPKLLTWTGVGAVALLIRGGPARRLVPAALASLLLLGATRLLFMQTGYWQASYLRLHLGLPLLALAAALPAGPVERFLRPRLALPLLLAVGLGCALIARAAPRTTEQLEHRWLHQVLPEQPEGCELRWVEEAGKHNLSVAWHLVPGAPPPQRIRSAEDARVGLLPGTCRLYLRSSLCATRSTRRRCDEIERLLHLEEIGRAELPALPSYDEHPYAGELVPVVLFRVSP